MPTAVPHAMLVERPLAPVPTGPFHSEAALRGKPGLSQGPCQVIEGAPSSARICPFDDAWPSNAADANTCTKSVVPTLRSATAIDRPPANNDDVAPLTLPSVGLGAAAVQIAVARSGPLLTYACTVRSFNASCADVRVNSHHTFAFGANTRCD